MKQAKKGGEWVSGVFYKGGQFLPSVEPQRGKFNRPANKTTKVRKVEVEPYKWVEAREGYRSLYSAVAGVLATVRNGEMVFCASEKTLNYYGYTEAKAQELVAQYNAGERWIAA